MYVDLSGTGTQVPSGFPSGTAVTPGYDHDYHDDYDLAAYGDDQQQQHGSTQPDSRREVRAAREAASARAIDAIAYRGSINLRA